MKYELEHIYREDRSKKIQKEAYIGVLETDKLYYLM